MSFVLCTNHPGDEISFPLVAKVKRNERRMDRVYGGGERERGGAMKNEWHKVGRGAGLIFLSFI